MKLMKWTQAAVLAALLCGCVKSPNMERIAEETKNGLQASWADKGVTVTAVNLEPVGKDRYAGTVVVKGDGWEDEAKLEVTFKDEQISWKVEKWAMGK